MADIFSQIPHLKGVTEHNAFKKMGSILPCCLPCGKAGGLQILSRRRRDQGIAVRNYSFTLDALTLKPYGFCNVRGQLAFFPFFLDELSTKPDKTQGGSSFFGG
jgi:hypothetical protein